MTGSPFTLPSPGSTLTTGILRYWFLAWRAPYGPRFYFWMDAWSMPLTRDSLWSDSLWPQVWKKDHWPYSSLEINSISKKHLRCCAFEWRRNRSRVTTCVSCCPMVANVWDKGSGQGSLLAKLFQAFVWATSSTWRRSSRIKSQTYAHCSRGPRF